MVLSFHAVTGSLVAGLFPEAPALGLSLALASHYVLDMIPHKEYNLNSSFFDKDRKDKNKIFDREVIWDFTKICLDFLLGIILSLVVYFLFYQKSPTNLLLCLGGALAGVLPDFLQFVYSKFKFQPFILTQKTHDFFHHEKKERLFFLGLYGQTFVVVILLVASFLAR